MASTDARPIPIKNTAYRVVFPILDADGDLVTGASGLDSEISKDQGTFADCTNEATEIATSSGMYYLDLTSTEMNADCVAIIVKTSTSGAKTTVIVLYPQESGDIKVDIQSAAGTAWASGAITAASIAADAITAAKIADGAIDAATFASGAINAAAIATDAITAAKIAADAIGASELAADAVTEIQSGLMLAASYTAPLSAAGTRSALGMASANLDTQLGLLATAANLAIVAGYIDTEITAIINAVADLPTNAELATALGTADDATLAAIATLNTMLTEMWQKDGLDSANPSTVTPSAWTFAGITITISGDGTTTSTFTRSP